MNLYISEDEMAIEGTALELNKFSNAVLTCKNGDIRHFDASLNTSPEPYDSLLEKMVLACNGSKIKCSVSGKTLKLEFSESTKEIVSSYFFFPLDSATGSHNHFDKIGNEDYFDNDSIDMVIQVGE